MFDDWLRRHAKLQEAFHPASERAPGTEGWRRYVDYNIVALIRELAEALDELDIRPWRTGWGVTDKAAFTEEMVDVLHFAANLLIAAGVTDDELMASYEAKMAENYRRLDTGRSVATT